MGSSNFISNAIESSAVFIDVNLIKIVEFGLLVVIFSGLIFFIKSNKTLNRYKIRKIDGIDEIELAIAESAEQGRPVMYTSGLTGLGPLLTACLGVLRFIAKKTAQLRANLIIPHYYPEVMALTELTVNDVYHKVPGAKVNPDFNRFLSDEQFAYTAGYIGTAQREKPGAAFLFGDYAAESLILAEAGKVVGARQVAGTTSPEQVAFFVCACDKTLIGEEVFAASAYLTKDPIQEVSIILTDRIKIIILLVIIIAVIYKTLTVYQTVAP